ncbi:Rv1733c family protein [Streptomyces hirsutus]|uniref:Rv1733c family protein n=1 Tax=Streptomyces hirsutus TaxID=35620 RepID=UPI00332CD609
MRVISGLWRWRHNPLCRPTDLAEGLLALVALLLVLVAAPLVGALAGSATEDALQRSVREQHKARHQVRATVVRVLEPARPDLDPEGISGQALRTRVMARWTAPDGTGHQRPVLVRLKDPRPGGHFPLWTDAEDRPTARPLDTATATTHAVLVGFGAALLTAALIEGARRLMVRRMVRHRYAVLDRAWDKAGPDWGRTGTGS